MPSQMPLPSDNLEPIVLPLVKYSYATVSSDHVAPLPWTHISENKLFAVFATVRIQTSTELEEQQRFRVVNDLKGAMLEDLDLNELARQGRLGVDRMKVLKTSQTPDVHVIIRPPTMAMRFPWPNGQMHRFQIRFSQDSDYYRALSMFSGVRCPLNEAGPESSTKSVARPASALPSISRPSQIYFNLTSPRPATAAPSYGAHLEHEITHLSNDTSSIAALPHDENIFGNHRRPDMPFSPMSRSLRTWSDQNRKTQKNIRQEDNTVHHYDRLENPGHDPIVPLDFDCPSSSAPGRLTRSDQELSYATSSQQRRLENIIYQPQPSTAPVYKSQNDLLPPRRELPFTRPTVQPVSHLPDLMAKVRKKGNKEIEQNASQGNSTRANPRKARTKKAVTAAPKKVINTRKRAAEAKSKGEIPSVEEILGKTHPAAVLTEDVTRRGRSEAPQRVSLVGETALDEVQNREHFTSQPSKGPSQTETILADQVRDITDGRVEATMEDVVEDSQEGLPVTDKRETRRKDAAVGTRGPLRERSLNGPPPRATPGNPLSREMQVLLNGPDFVASPDFSRYGDFPEDERRAALETFMCQQLESPSFHTLCKDMSRMWQSMYFGRENDEV
ncbi:MAG: hypothetical protein Q9160_004031 [Pyrenula sp. 1 TL-2023]